MRNIAKSLRTKLEDGHPALMAANLNATMTKILSDRELMLHIKFAYQQCKKFKI